MFGFKPESSYLTTTKYVVVLIDRPTQWARRFGSAILYNDTITRIYLPAKATTRRNRGRCDRRSITIEPRGRASSERDPPVRLASRSPTQSSALPRPASFHGESAIASEKQNIATGDGLRLSGLSFVTALRLFRTIVV